MGLIGFISLPFEFGVFKYVKDNVSEIGGYPKKPSHTFLSLPFSISTFRFYFPTYFSNILFLLFLSYRYAEFMNVCCF